MVNGEVIEVVPEKRLATTFIAGLACLAPRRRGWCTKSSQWVTW